MQYDHNNIFAQFIRKEIPVDILYENEHSLAFFDINPLRKIHILIIPKGPYMDIYDFTKNASPEEQVAINRAIADIAEQYDLSSDGFRVITNCRKFAGQEVPHLHFHILGGENIGAMVSQ